MKDKFTDKFIDISGKDFNIREQLNYNCVYYIKCSTGNSSSDNYGNGYEGYSIIGKCYINKINEPIPETYLSVWVSLKKIAEGVFEATDKLIMGVKYVSVEYIKDDFTLYYDKKLNKVYGNVTFEKNINKMEYGNKIDIQVLSGEIVRLCLDAPKLFDACSLVESKVREYTNQELKAKQDECDSWISIDVDLPKLNEEYLVAIDLEDGEEGLCSFSAEYRVNENKWVWSNTKEECQGTVLFWKEKPKPPIIPFKKNPIQQSNNLDSFERLSYGQCVHGENLASCTECNKPENNYYERLPKTK